MNWFFFKACFPTSLGFVFTVAVCCKISAGWRSRCAPCCAPLCRVLLPLFPSILPPLSVQECRCNRLRRRKEEGELKMLLVISNAVKLCQKYAASSSFSAPLYSLWVCNCICYSFDGLEEPSRPWCTRYYSLLAPTALGPPKITAWSLLFKVSHQGEWGGG